MGIQIVQGNPHLRSLLGWHLQQAGYCVYQSADIYHARDIHRNRQPNLAIVDSQLPDGDGLEFCRWLHQQQQSLILMLSARNTETDIVAGLKAGADDYLCKPFGMQGIFSPSRSPAETESKDSTTRLSGFRGFNNRFSAAASPLKRRADRSNSSRI